jgi:uncharacterized protein with HEPN domain
MDSDSPKLLWDALTAAENIQRFTENKSYEEFETDILLRSAIERQFQILGEALNRLQRTDPDTANRISDVRRIIAFRNVIVHGYDVLDMGIVWTNAVERLPDIVDVLKSLLTEC